MRAGAGRVYRFGQFCLDTEDRLLYRDGEMVPLPPKVFDTLLLLVSSSGRVLTKDEMMKQLWPDTFVEEGTLAQYIFLLRKVLGEAKWIENHPRRGYRFTAPVEETPEGGGEAPMEEEAIAERTRFGWPRLTIAGLVVLAAIAAGATLWIGRKSAAPNSFNSVAVLPFRTASGSGEAYLAEGMTDALITKLANLEGLRVVSYSRVRRYKDSPRDAAEIGQQLGVDAVIEGTLRVISGRMRLSVHAVDTKTADTLWADDGFEADSDGALTIERQVAEVVARRLRGTLTASEQTLLAKREASNAEAYDLLLRARSLLAATPGDLETAVRMLERALALDPEFAEAYGWLAFAQHRVYGRGLGGREVLRAAISNANQALSKDASASIALRALAHIQHSTGREVESLLMARRALETAPDDLDAVAAAAEAYFRTGFYDRAIPLYERALAEEPENREFRSQLARIHLFHGEYKKGVQVISALPPSQAGTFGMLVYAEAGQMDKALEAAWADRQSLGFYAYTRGGVMAAAGDRTGAKKAWMDAVHRGEALIAKSENPYTRYGLSLCYAALGQKEKASQHIRQLLAPDPRHPVFLFFAAESLALVGERREALSTLRAAVESGFFNLPMIDYMGRSLAGTFRSLRDEPEFNAIKADLARRVDELRARY